MKHTSHPDPTFQDKKIHVILEYLKMTDVNLRNRLNKFKEMIVMIRIQVTQK